MSASDTAFRELVQIFANRDNRILEIEILPPAVGPLLQDGCSIGITKKYLAQAFVFARQTFLANSTPVPEPKPAPILSPKKGNLDEKIKDVSVSSEIILLFDCEHLTACNWRKRRLQALIQCCDIHNPTSRDNLLTVLERELTLMTTYLCSPLRRHTKSPTLWEHRLWVLKHWHFVRNPRQPLNDPRTLAPEQPPAMEFVVQLLKEELDIVLRAGELHPRNYYAFSYIRELHGVLGRSMEEVADCLSRLARSMVDPSLDWCLAHTTDISGWTFLLHLLETVPDPAVRADTVSKAVRFARDVGWEGESLWTFVDLAARAFDLTGLVRDALPIRSFGDSEPHPVLPGNRETSESETGWKAWLRLAKAYWADNR